MFSMRLREVVIQVMHCNLWYSLSGGITKYKTCENLNLLQNIDNKQSIWGWAGLVRVSTFFASLSIIYI